MLKNRALLPIANLFAPLLLLLIFRRLPSEVQFFLLGKALYWVSALLVLGLATLLFSLKRKFTPSLSTAAAHLVGACLSLTLAYLATQTFEPRLRVQWDEAELYDTSLSMHFRQTALTPAMALPGPNPGEIVPIFFRLGRRPPLYPFVVSLGHFAFGASENVPLLVNSFLLSTLLFFTFCVAYSSCGLTAGLASVFFLASAPLLFWQSTSGSMDLLSALAVFAMAYAAAVFWRTPSISSFGRFVLVGLAASYTRYEVVGGFALLLGLGCWHAKKNQLSMRAAMNYLTLLPALLLPLLLVLFNASGSFAESAGKAVFHPSHFAQNAPAFLLNFFSPSSHIYSGLLNIAGFAILLETLRRKKWTASVSLLALVAGFSLFLTLAFFDGNPTSFESARLFLLPSLAMSLVPLLLLSLFPGQNTGHALLLAAILSFGLNLKMNWKTKLLPDSLATMASEGLRHFMLEDLRAREPKVLYVFDPPEFLLSLGAPAIGADFFLQHENELQELHAQGEIHAVHWIRTGTEIPNAENEALRKQIEIRYASKEVARLPLQPIPTVIYELRGVD